MTKYFTKLIYNLLYKLNELFRSFTQRGRSKRNSLKATQPFPSVL